MENWYAVHTKPHKERQVEAILAGRGIEVYLPSVPAPRRGNRTSVRSFFPCYLFARADLNVVGLWPLVYTPGARGVVMVGGVPARVDDDLITAIRDRLARRDAAYSSAQVFEPGDRVVVTAGPMENFEGLFDRRLSPAGRVRVLLQLVQRWTPVEMHVDDLRRVSRLARRDIAFSP